MPAEIAISVEEVPPGENETQKPPAAKPMVGIIYPPPEVRNIVDKTAGFVARNGPEFETRIRANEVSNAKFNFLNPGDPYHAYYRHKVKEFLEGKATEPVAALIAKLVPSKPIAQVIEAIIPKDPPPIFEFTVDPPSINTFELDIVKLTAQFVARNGRLFLTKLMGKEHRSYWFDFLRPQHNMFNYFTKLVEQYTKVLIPPKDLKKKLGECATAKNVMKEIRYRVEWEKLQERQRKKEAEEKERERVAYAQIDWHNFVVVETVDYQINEQGQFPPPLKQEEVGDRVIAEERFEQFGEALAEEEDVVMEVEEGEDDDEESEDSEEEEEDEEQEEGEEVEEVEEVVEEKEKETREKIIEKPKSTIEAKSPEREEEAILREALKAVAVTPPLKAVENNAEDQDMELQDMEEGDSDMEESDDEDEKETDDKEDTVPTPTTPVEKDVQTTQIPASKDGLTMPPPPALPPQPETVQIRKDYDPKAPKTATGTTQDENYLVSPITGMKIPADKMEEHMRIGLLDQRWIEQRSQNIERAQKQVVFAPGGSITENLKKLAERRTDIFGEGDVETQIGKKIGEEEATGNKEKVIWDGHSGSMESTTRKAQANITIEEQIEALHKAQGLLPDEEKERIGPQKIQAEKEAAARKEREISRPKNPPPPPKPKIIPPAPRPIPMPISMPPIPPPPTPVNVGMPPSMPMMNPRPVMGMPIRPPMMAPQGIIVRPMMGGVPPPMGMPRPPPVGPPQRQVPPPPMPPPFAVGGPLPDGEPPNKKQKTEDNLMPEHQFLSFHRGTVTFRIQVPVSNEKPEWKLNGQMINVTLPLTDQVSVLKARLYDELGMPTGKQKLQYEGMFIKDSNSLAYYNFTNGSVVQLVVKVRGGAKR